MKTKYLAWSWHVVAQVLASAAQYLNMAEPMIPSKYKPLGAAVLTILQFALHQKAFSSLPPQ